MQTNETVMEEAKRRATNKKDSALILTPRLWLQLSSDWAKELFSSSVWFLCQVSLCLNQCFHGRLDSLGASRQLVDSRVELQRWSLEWFLFFLLPVFQGVSEVNCLTLSASQNQSCWRHPEPHQS